MLLFYKLTRCFGWLKGVNKPLRGLFAPKISRNIGCLGIYDFMGLNMALRTVLKSPKLNFVFILFTEWHDLFWTNIDLLDDT